MFNSGVSLSAIAAELGITKQAVARHVKNGMPTDSVGVAVGWYEGNVRSRGRSRASVKSHALPASIAHWLGEEPIELDDFDFWHSDAVEQIALSIGADEPALDTPEAMFAFCDLVLHAVLSVIRLHVAQMPTRCAHRANPQHPATAESALQEWSDAFFERWGKEPMHSPFAKGLPRADKSTVSVKESIKSTGRKCP